VIDKLLAVQGTPEGLYGRRSARVLASLQAEPQHGCSLAMIKVPIPGRR
jgi:hypothetical protein